jgi:hypothetical protein
VGAQRLHVAGQRFLLLAQSSHLAL